MLVNFTARKSARLYGKALNFRMTVDLEKGEVDFLFQVDGRITLLPARAPRISEVDTPEKLEDFMRRVDLDRIALSLEETAA